MKYDKTTAAVSLTVFNLALDTGPLPPPARSPAVGPPPVVPRPLMTRRGTRVDPSNTPSRVVQAVPVDAVEAHLAELLDVIPVELDPAEVIRSRQSSSALRYGVPLCSAGTTSPPGQQTHRHLWRTVTLTFDLNTSTFVAASGGTFTQIMVYLSLSVVKLGTRKSTDRQTGQTREQ